MDGGLGRLPAPGRTRWRQVGLVALVLLLAGTLAAGLTTLYLGLARPGGPAAGAPGAASPGTTTAPAGPHPVEPVVSPPGPVVPALDSIGPAPAPAVVAARLSGPLRDRRLGSRVSAVVADLTTGGTLYDANGRRPATPASTTKLTTAAAVLASYPAEHRFRTRVLA